MHRLVSTFIIVIALVALCPVAMATSEGLEGSDAKEATKLKVGDMAPDFSLPAAEGSEEKAQTKLSSFRGKKNVLIAFYPKAFTGGCTKQLCGYRDDFATFKSNDTEVIAVSSDEQDYSDKFKLEYKFPFTVLGDKETKVIRRFGVAMKLRGGGTMAKRAVFLVDKKGVLRHIDREYSIEDDKQPLYDAIAKLEAD